MKNESKIITRIRTFFVWSEKKEQAWLEEMSRKGWHLKKASFWRYTFEKSKPVNFVYQFDFRFGSSKDVEEYLGIFREAGWELISRSGGWHYFRKPFREGEQNRIYSDRESLKKKYRTILAFLLITGIPLFHNFLIIFRRPGLTGFYQYFWPVNTLFLILWIYAVIRIFLYMKRLS